MLALFLVLLLLDYLVVVSLAMRGPSGVALGGSIEEAIVGKGREPSTWLTPKDGYQRAFPTLSPTSDNHIHYAHILDGSHNKWRLAADKAPIRNPPTFSRVGVLRKSA